MKNKLSHIDWINYGVLRVIDSNANVSILLSENFSYFNLMKTLNHLKNNALLRDYSGVLELTDHGKDELIKLERKLEMGNVSKLVIPDFKYIIDKIDIDDVYLP